jgi:hypothetical protein
MTGELSIRDASRREADFARHLLDCAGGRSDDLFNR